MLLIIFSTLAGVTACGVADGLLMQPTGAATYEEEDLIGSWSWLGSTYYVFNADGTGTMGTLPSMPINWAASDGILSVCTTPVMCRIGCAAPSRWSFVIDGDTLECTNIPLAVMSFTYTRE